LPLFKLVDFGVSLLYRKKGMLKEKQKADEYIRKNKAYISKRYSELQKKNKILKTTKLFKSFQTTYICRKDLLMIMGF